MTTPELNAYLDETCFGVDQSRKMCGADLPASLKKCVEQHNGMPPNGCMRGAYWATCPHRKPYTPPDYCSDWAAFGKLVEWLNSQDNPPSLFPITASGEWSAVLTPGVRRYQASGPTMQLALARAVYEATKGK